MFIHPNDEMTPKERMDAFVNGKEYDRLPTMPFMTTVSAKISGMSLREKSSSPYNDAHAQILVHKRFGNDSITSEYGLHGIGVALGSILSDPENGVPAITDHILKDLSDLDKLDINLVTSKYDSFLINRLETTEILLEEIGRESEIGIDITGPFTAASSIYSPERLLRSIRKDREMTHKLLRLSTDALKNVIREYSKYGSDISFALCDPVASGTMLSLKNYVEFVKPYTVEIVDFIHQFGISVTYHICGDTSNIIEEMVATGVDTLSLDNIVDLEFAKEKVGNKICLVGNVDPVSIFLLGSENDVDEDVKKCFRKAHNSSQGFILASGCDIPLDTPTKNIDAYMNAARKYGKYGVNSDIYL